MAKLVFNPQKVFAPAYILDPAKIKSIRSFFNPDYDYFVDYGGRGGGKTKDKVRSIVLESTIRRVRVLITREFQNSIDESVKAEIESCIEEEGLSHFFKITEKQITAKNGSKFIFKGIKNNINNIKSIADVDIVMVEEAENVSDLSWQKLLPSIRPISGRAIVVVIFNPASELDATWQTWIVNTPPRTLLTKCNFPDNKYFPPFLEAQRQHDERVLPPKKYKNKWFGIPSGSEGDIIIDQDWLKSARFASRHPEWVNVSGSKVSYDPAGQGKDNHAIAYKDGNTVKEVQEWPKSPDLRIATNKALNLLRKNEADEFIYDECGGFGDGVSVFVDDNINGNSYDESGEVYPSIEIKVSPFNAGDSIKPPEDKDDPREEEKIKGTDKHPSETYANHKAWAHGITAQHLYNTFRFIELGERDIDPEEMLSLDIEDDDLWIKIMREMSTALWIKSEVNSKKKVESKEAMKKRTGQDSPNLNDAIVMLQAPKEAESLSFFDVF
jgi:phage terminase large subunit